VSAPRTGSTRTGSAAVLVALACLAAVVGRGFWGYSHDDAFITYRYADQWAHGNGLTFNTGEHVLGTSAPGYALLLGLLSRAAGSPGVGVPEWGTLLSLAALLSLAWTLASAASNASASIQLVVPLLFGVGALLWRWNVEMLGSEALPVVGLVAAAAHWVFERERPVLGSLALAAAMILRLDACLAAASIAIVLWHSRGRFPWRLSFAGAAPVVVWLVGLYSRFGTLVPATLAGKRAEYSGGAAAYTLAEWHWLRRTLPLPGCVTLLSLALLGAVLGARRGLFRQPFVQALGLWLLAHEVLYRVVRVPFAPWYHEGLVNAVLALAAYGAAAIAEAALGVAKKRNQEVAAVLASGLLLLPVLVPSALYVREQWGKPPDPRFEVYRAIGLYLFEHARSPCSVVALEVGILGYFSRCRVVDLAGLVTPEFLGARSGKSLTRFPETSKPGYVVDVPSFRVDALAFVNEPDFERRYRLIREFPSPSGGAPYRLLERRP
jgi:arabinofuranosyltransferase